MFSLHYANSVTKIIFNRNIITYKLPIQTYFHTTLEDQLIWVKIKPKVMNTQNALFSSVQFVEHYEHVTFAPGSPAAKTSVSDLVSSIAYIV